MNGNKLNVKFTIDKGSKSESESDTTALFEYENKLPDFYKKILDNDEVNFYYMFKDAAISIEEVLFKKIHKGGLKNNDKKIIPVFRVSVNEKELFHYHLEDSEVTSEDFKGNEVDIFYFLKKIAETFESALSKQHKSILLGK